MHVYNNTFSRCAIECEAVSYCSLLFWSKKAASTTEPIESCENCIEILNKARHLLYPHATMSDVYSIFPLTEKQLEAVQVMLASRMNQQQICLVLDFCSTEIEMNDSIDMDTSEVLYSEETSVDNEEENTNCDKCLKLTERLIDFSQITLRQNNEYSLCRSVAIEEKAACYTFVQKHGGKLVGMLFTHQKPFGMCKDLELCADKTLDNKIQDLTGEVQLNEVQSKLNF
jgi:hypothetical protein